MTYNCIYMRKTLTFSKYAKLPFYGQELLVCGQWLKNYYCVNFSLVVFSKWRKWTSGLFVLKRQSTNTRFFYEQHFFSTQPQCCLTFSWIELQVFLWCCLIYITIIMLRCILHLVYLCPCLGLGLFMLYLWSTYHFQPHFHYNESYNLIKTNKIVLLSIF